MSESKSRESSSKKKSENQSPRMKESEQESEEKPRQITMMINRVTVETENRGKDQVTDAK
jgi:hypothetical protein